MIPCKEVSHESNRTAVPLPILGEGVSTMRLCDFCYAPLPEPAHRGHRPRKFCPHGCKQKYYRRHKRATREAEAFFQQFEKQAEEEGTVRHMLWEQMKEERNKVVAELIEVQSKLVEVQLDLAWEQKHGDSLEKSLQYYRRRDAGDAHRLPCPLERGWVER